MILGLTQSRVKEALKEIEKESFRHPVSLDQKDIFKILRSLRYSTYVREFERWEYEKPVFEKAEAMKISALLMDALKNARPDQMVYFSIGKSHEKTKGNIFSVDQQLCLHFLSLKGKVQEQKMAYKEFHQWKLVPQAGQNNLKTKGILGIKGTRTDWIIMDMPGNAFLGDHDIAPAVPEAPGKKETVPARKLGEVETKLRFLKEMLSEGLITQKDYEKKKEELLKGIHP